MSGEPTTRTLPAIGCNGRGVQDSSAARPVSMSEPSIEEQFRLVARSGLFDSFDRLPMPGEVARFRECIDRLALPVRTASWFYAVGQPERDLTDKLALAAAVGARQHNIMLHWHDVAGREIADAEVVDFYLRAYDEGMKLDVEPTMELHVNMWSEDPRRVRPVAEAVRARGIPFNFTLDYSHVIFKIGNAQELAVCGLTDDVATGRVVLDPFAPGNLVDEWLSLGIVRWLQVRCAAPNGPRNTWSLHDPTAPVAGVPAHSIFPYAAGEPGRGILYPFAEPAPGEWHSPWHWAQTAMTREVVRRVLTHHRDHDDSRLRAITTEMITLPDYALNAKFSLIGQNEAVARHVRQTWASLASQPAAPAAPERLSAGDSPRVAAGR